MATITAQQILDETGYTAANHISLTNLEYLIDNAINYINSEAGLSISNLSGAAGSKTVTVTNAQAPIIKMLSKLFIRAYVDMGPNVAVGGLAVSTLTSDPQYALFLPLITQGINRLRGRSFERT